MAQVTELEHILEIIQTINSSVSYRRTQITLKNIRVKRQSQYEKQ
jgi:hypothetical protein